MSLGVSEFLQELNSFAKVDLGVQQTSIDRLERLGDRLGIALLAKRDDTLVLAMGGNKIRQLEYYLGPTRQQGADTILITGAVQSNFVRLTAAAARKLGWQAVVQLEARVPKDDVIYNRSGNVLLNHLLGAEVHYFAEGENEAAADANLDDIAERLRAEGRKPYVIHLGIDHPPIGGLGYAQCAVECFAQCCQAGEMPDYVVIPSGSGLTHAGFLVGARAMGWEVPVYGICVRRDAEQQRARITRRVGELNALLQGRGNITDQDIHVDDVVLAPGYGQMNGQVMAAISNSAHDEALLLDPVYSGRTMAGLASLVERGIIEKGKTVLFIHTGGTPALFAYQNDLMPA